MNVRERADQAKQGGGDARLARAHALLAEPSVAVVSFDIFDTLLWRRVAEPVDSFPLVGMRLLERGQLEAHVRPNAFKKLRIAAEGKARMASHAAGRGVEPTLDDVYCEFPVPLMCAATPEELVATELEVERELLAPDLDMLELVRAARELEKLVVAVSDTYLSELELRSLLDTHFTLETAIDRVFSSSAYGDGKTGTLFDKVLTELGRQPNELLHIGDNEHADVASPRKLGIRAIHFERRPKALERVIAREQHYLDDEAVREHGDHGLTAIRSKVLHRRECADTPEELRSFWAYGASALGPALSGFAEWIHDRVGQLELERAYCLMREGELLSKLINGAGSYLDSDVDAEPLWLSRHVCARASIFEGTPAELRSLLSRRQAPTVQELCTTLGIDVRAAAVLHDHADARLNEVALADEVFEEISSNPELRGPMVAEARLLRERVVESVRSRVPGGEGKIALVDLGWGATIQKLLQDILHREQVPIVTYGLYLVTHDLAATRMLNGLEVQGYLGSCGLPGAAVRSIMRSPEILEQVCMPDVGSQIDLTADLEPVLSDPIDAALVQSAERGAVQSGILAFQREWARYGDLTPGYARLVEDDSRELLLAQLVRACVAPTSAEANVFSTWIHDENFGSTAHESIIGGRHAARAFRHMDPSALMALPMSEVYWPFGLAALEDEHLAAATDAVATARMAAEAFYSVVEVGDFEVYYDNGFGFGETWKVGIESRRNRFGLSYARALVRADEVRGIRIDPVKAPSVVRIDWIALTCWVRDEPLPRELNFDTPETIEQLSIRGASPLGPKLWLAGGDPQFELDLRAAIGEGVYEVVVECAYAVMPAAPPRADPHSVELHRRSERRSRAVKRFVRQVESRTGFAVGEPLRKSWRRLRSRVAR